MGVENELLDVIFKISIVPKPYHQADIPPNALLTALKYLKILN